MTEPTAAAAVLTGMAGAGDELQSLYRRLHAHPELSMQEHRTAGLIEQRLAVLGMTVFRCGGTGVVGVLDNGPGPTIAFRADTDALPVEERTGLTYASTADGTLADGTSTKVMHACGHDTHVASLLTAASLLHGARAEWSGTIVFIFQPGEEIAAGAQAMIDDGLWERAPKPAVILGQHVSPGPAGVVGHCTGTAASMADSWEVLVRGRGAHGSQPHHSVDPIVQAAHTITRIQTVVSREVDPVDAAVVTVGKFAGGTKENIIPDSAVFTLNVRTFDEPLREHVLESLRRIIRAEAMASGAPEPEITELSRFPRLVNDAEVTRRAVEALAAQWGQDGVTEAQPLMGSEDFGALGDAIDAPSCFWFIGGTDPERHAAATAAGTVSTDIPSNHSPFFAPVPELTLPRMVEAAVVTSLEFLERP
ncbi:hippurate hydrolase [Prauserella isguenensis]|uniref:Hippurate hydrolase n=1 Tax=Prauserella isguenensis TaxID=1470180 RepID=A0A839RZ09_9PSEU|nr:amidohydrolase [Prauserella isguenensis]MBB3051031.1 hippurate hydrolase [Prauserella isguenensis]